MALIATCTSETVYSQAFIIMLPARHTIGHNTRHIFLFETWQDILLTTVTRGSPRQCQHDVVPQPRNAKPQRHPTTTEASFLCCLNILIDPEYLFIRFEGQFPHDAKLFVPNANDFLLFYGGK